MFLINGDRDIINASWTFLVDFSVFDFILILLLKLIYIYIYNL